MSRTSTTDRPRYEYLVKAYRDEEWLNKMGAEGWNLVDIHHSSGKAETTYWESNICYFKRMTLPEDKQ